MEDIGRPRIMLVGLGVDEPAKRMVEFLAKCELDISLITFHGFEQGGETLLARQVEVQPPLVSPTVKSIKLVNQAKLDKLLADLGLKQNYEELIKAIKQGLGESTFQRPNPPGYSFSLPEVSAAGNPVNRAYIALYTSEKLQGNIQVLLQPRAVEAVGKERAQQFAEKMGSKFELKTDGCGEIWIDGHKPATNYTEQLMALGQAIAAGWKAKMEKMEKQDKAEAAEVSDVGGHLAE